MKKDKMIYKVLLKRNNELISPVRKFKWKPWTLYKTRLGEPKYSNIAGKIFEVNRGFYAFVKVEDAIKYCEKTVEYLNRNPYRDIDSVIVFKGSIPAGAHYFEDDYAIIANKMGIFPEEIYKIEIN